MPPSSDLKHKAPSHMVAKLYSHISRTVFILTKNFRAKDDPVLTKLLDALQMGDLTEHDKALLNSRVLTTETAAQFTTRLLETSSSAELSSTIGIATSLNSHRNYNNLRYADYVATHRERTQQSAVFAAPADIRSNNTFMSDALRRYIEANVPMIKHSAPIQPMWPGTKSLKRTTFNET